MFLEGRPPVNVGVTSNGDVFGGTQISFGDVLGDKQFNIFAASISQYRTLSLSLRQPRRGASSTRSRATRRRSSSTASSSGVFYDPALAPFISRDPAHRDAHRPRRQRRSASTRSTATAASSSRAASSSSASSTTIPACRSTRAAVPAAALRPARSSATAR